MPPFVGGGVVILDPDRIANPASFASGGAGAAAATCDVLTLLEAIRNGALIFSGARAAARQARIGSEAQTQGPGWGYSWLGSILIESIAAGVGYSAGTISLGGVYGHSWTADFERDLIVLVMTNTAIEGTIGQFARDVKSVAAKHFASPGTLKD